MNKILSIILHPSKIAKQIEWNYYKKRLANIGKNSQIGQNFSIINPDGISIGDNFSGGCDIALWSWNAVNIKGDDCKLIIKNNVSITDRCIISAANRIEIGNGCLLGRDTFITDNSHGENISIDELNISPHKRNIFSKGTVIIGDNVWTGKNVCIMPNVKIGSGAIIGANSVVTHNIPPYSVAVGSPAKVIKTIEK
ncbi:DapH/DapD/GlmU-related protein [uncultured Eubacterium sp.]|uniref:acyltransferase n=1 Tax=uncultured Eubacterium sp. TaxID=165185 RepID=UPI0025E9BEE3|nr:acyltransferase [uncultured Eubacterium sp.]